MILRTVIVAMFAVAALLALVFLFPGTPPQEQASKISMVLDRWPPAWYFSVAEQQGYLAEEGLGMEFFNYNSTPESIEVFIRNKSMDCVDITSNDLFNMRENGVNVVLIFPIDRSEGADALVASPSIESVPELRGKKIGVQGFNTFSHMFAVKILEKYNLSETDVMFFNVLNQDVPQAIADGRIDAGEVYEPALSEALSRGQEKIADSTELPSGLIFDGIGCREEVVNARGGDVQKMVDAWFSAKEFEKKHRNDAHATIAYAHGATLEEVENGLSGNFLYGLEDSRNALLPSGDGSIARSLEMANGFLLSRGQASSNVAPPNLVNWHFVQNAKVACVS